MGVADRNRQKASDDRDEVRFSLKDPVNVARGIMAPDIY